MLSVEEMMERVQKDSTFCVGICALSYRIYKLDIPKPWWWLHSVSFLSFLNVGSPVFPSVSSRYLMLGLLGCTVCGSIANRIPASVTTFHIGPLPFSGLISTSALSPKL